jgi:hypothetical protein
MTYDIKMYAMIWVWTEFTVVPHPSTNDSVVVVVVAVVVVFNHVTGSNWLVTP